ncbi:hypothetical protein GZH47_33740 (plasmid) [Paenibacillus rhizovicinus]|uniref:Uncharacterized protein n=1 Tax=Paenibacillus rhizovicinus TaxID=2704463 RepID=A0A6C0PBL1_9BACL|nr:hypothetical protein [Paenibacillus rhizovicinus]QHW35856.1 hypothetical protein GZH47_33740 [Paenibacillus rhizovicinus]
MEQFKNVDLFGEPASIQPIRDLKTIGDRVMSLLHEHEAARNSDNVLIYLYWRTYDSCVSLEDMVYATPPEDIRRCRQKINQNGLYHPTDAEVARKRRRRQSQYHQHSLNI